MAKYEVYSGENQNEEALILMGRVNALAAYINKSKREYMDCQIIASMLGFELEGSDKENKEDENKD